MSVTLSSGVRQNLQALQSTADMLSTVQNRLATGKKVNSALDNPNSFFTAQSLEARAGDLGGLLDDMGQSIQTLKAADEGIKAITKLVEAAKGKANQALQSSDDTARADYLAEFNELRTQIGQIATDSGYKGKNLLTGDSLSVTFNEDGSSKLDVTGVDYSDAGTDVTGGDLGIAAATDWAGGATGDANIGTALDELTSALTTLRKQASTFGTNLTTVENRQNFTKAMINTLQAGADKLTLADNNEEGAKLLALNTRQQLASTAVSFASQADQNVLRLF